MQLRLEQKTIAIDALVPRLLRLARTENVFLLDGAAARHGGSRHLIAGLRPRETLALRFMDPSATLDEIDRCCRDFPFVFFTAAYEFGLKLNAIPSRHSGSEPDIWLMAGDGVLVHDYLTNESKLVGTPEWIAECAEMIESIDPGFETDETGRRVEVSFDVSRDEYVKRVDEVRELIRSGLTYQTNLTQPIRVALPDSLHPTEIFRRLRHLHPAPFAAFISRGKSTVISASPERFFSIRDDVITAAPIKGTRPRGDGTDSDDALRKALRDSEKDRAENVMIVDLLRNDLGRICEFGSVEVERLCEIEEHPSVFHLVSTIHGKLRSDWRLSDVFRALFPCGSITGAPKISTMKIIDAIESTPRGLSMGAIGYFARNGLFGNEPRPAVDTSVAIRTMVVRGNRAEFNVGGGIVIDSDADDEYLESLTKATALLDSLTKSV